MEGSDVLLEGGYSKPIHNVAINQKEELMRAVKMHFTILRCKGELDQLRSGLSIQRIICTVVCIEQGKTPHSRQVTFLVYM